MRNEGGGFAASIYRAMPEVSIQVTSHLRYLIPAFAHPSFIGLQERFLAMLEMTTQESDVSKSPSLLV